MRKAAAGDFGFTGNRHQQRPVPVLFDGLIKWPADFKPLRKVGETCRIK